MKLLSCACVLAAGLICVPNPTLAAERPNVLFVIVDDLRPELGCYGNEEIETPHFDTFSQDERPSCKPTAPLPRVPRREQAP